MPRGFSQLLQLPKDPAAEAQRRVYFSDENEDVFFTARTAYKTPVAATTVRPISESVYQVLVYLESRAVQRARNRLAALGTKEEPSHRRWKRRVYQLVRRRIGEYLASAGTADHPSLPPCTTEEEVGLPKAERRDRTRTERGLAYLKRRREAHRQKTRAKGKSRPVASSDGAPRPVASCDGEASLADWSSASAAAWRIGGPHGEGSACSGGASSADWSSASAAAWWSSSSAADWSSATAGRAISEHQPTEKELYIAQFRPGYVDDREEQPVKRLRTPSPTQRMRSTMQAGSSSSAAPVQEEHHDSEDTSYETHSEQDEHDYSHKEQEKRDTEMEGNRVRKIEAQITEIYQQLCHEGKVSCDVVMEVPQLMEEYRGEEEKLMESVLATFAATYEYDVHSENSAWPQSTPMSQIEEEMKHMSKAYGDMATTPTQEEDRDEPVLPSRDTTAFDDEHITSYVQDHWAHSKQMSRANQRKFESFLCSAKGAGAPFVEVTETDVASHLAAMKFPMGEFSPPEKMALEPVKGSPGQWFRLDARRQHIHTMQSWEEEHHSPQWTFAVHGTSIRAARDVLDGGWQKALNVTGNVHGLYCEGMPRRECVMRYMTHAWEESLPKWCAAAAMMELMVDRSDTKVIHSQWVQQNLGSIAITAVIIHVVDLRKVYPAKFVGRVQVAGRTMQDMEIEAKTQ